MFGGKNIEFETVLTLENIPENAEDFLRSPNDIAIDERGNFYILDLVSATIFRWDHEGKFKGKLGKKGDGPGEFTFFSNVGGPQGYVSAGSNELYVYDGAKKTVSIFSYDGTFKSAIPFQTARGRTEIFRVLKNNDFLIFNSSYFSETPYRRVGAYNRDGSLIRQFGEVEDKTWYYSSKNGRRQVVLRPYATSLFMGYNGVRDQILMGDSSKTSFDILDHRGELIKTVSFKWVRQELTKEDRQEFQEQNWFKNQNFFTVDFPEEKAFYTHIYPVGDRGYLVFLQSVSYNDCNGIMIDPEGAVLGKFDLHCGLGGGLFGVREQVVAITTNEDDEFQVQVLRPKI